MDKTGTLGYANDYTKYLKSTIGTTKIQGLRHACLLTLLEDILAGDMKKFALLDKKFWIDFLRKCFPFLHFEQEVDSREWYVYVGTANEFSETADFILTNSTKYNLLDENIRQNGILTQEVTGKYFWIATAVDHTVEEINNVDFPGDYLTIYDNFYKSLAVKIDGIYYTVQVLKARIPLNNVYNITID